MRTSLMGVAALIALCVSFPAVADYDFSAITSNDPVNPGIGEAQLSMSVSDLGGGQVLFDFMNTGPDPATIALIAFEADILAGVDSLIQDGVNVEFSVDGSPTNLPGGPFDELFTVTADPPPASNGVDPGETLGVVVNILGGSTFADVIAALNSGDIRVGMHVISMGQSGNSESFINNVPGPSALMLMAVAGALAPRRRRRC